MATEFFSTFARFEYALKSTDYIKTENGEAKPDWEKFSKEKAVTDILNDENDLKEAIEYLLSHPPKKQIVENGQLKWTDRDPGNISRSELVIIYLRRVRNNLFHGGKYSNDENYDPTRTKELLQHSLTILDACLKADKNVCNRFDSAQL